MSAFIVYMFVLGLGTSLHCVSMCGPLVLTYAVKGNEDDPWYHKLTPNVAYQAAKVVSYVLVGVLVGFLGSFFKLDSIRPYVMYLAGAFMIVLGLGMTGKVGWAQRFTPRPPKFLMRWISSLRRKSTADAAAGHSSLATPISFGLMTGLLPCGPLMAAEVSAAASGSALTGAAGMAAFALGTAPLMIAFGTAGSLIPRAWKERMMVVLAVFVIFFGLVFINRGLTLTGMPNFNTAKAAVLGTGSVSSAAYKTGANGVVEVPLVIENGEYEPATLKIPADKPVQIVVDRREDSSCSKYLVFPQLGIKQALADNGTTIVNLPATKAGTYTMTCGMGMMQGTLVAGGSTGSSGGLSPLVALLFAVTAAAVAAVVVRRTRAPVAEPVREPVRHGGGKKRNSNSAKSSGNGRTAPAAARTAVLFGFSKAELIAVGAVVVAAAMLGLVLSGGLHL